MIPAPLYRDPIYDGAADPMVIRKEADNQYYMFYTQRRATQQVEGVSFAYGTAIGVAQSNNGRNWHYRGILDLDFEFGHNTFWAPEIVYSADEALYHMYVTYIQGIYTRWEGVATLEHYTSPDLFHWEHIGPLSFGSSRVIDPCVYPLPTGGWRMWYKDERQGSHTCYADSADLYHWEYRGVCTDDCNQEGPNVFALGGYYWLIADVWAGQGVYRSDNLTHFVRQEGNLLQGGGNRPTDCVNGSHADVFCVNDKAYIVYFTHLDQLRSAVQMAELQVQDGKLICLRDDSPDVDWSHQ